eukprot:GHVU01098270.1.p1 GENE.GHVU01098270.1~~GHVU01098270.1.p1  ORF type:complete len:117 (-),score=2.07 GHVU01098270.1:5-355(-)
MELGGSSRLGDLPARQHKSYGLTGELAYVISVRALVRRFILPRVSGLDRLTGQLMWRLDHPHLTLGPPYPGTPAPSSISPPVPGSLSTSLPPARPPSLISLLLLPPSLPPFIPARF